MQGPTELNYEKLNLNTFNSSTSTKIGVMKPEKLETFPLHHRAADPLTETAS